MIKSIPLRISPYFWLTAALIGFLNSGSIIGALIWVVIIFVSILVHEYGHAITAKLFGQSPRIELVAFGGLTYPEGPRLSFWKEFIVVFNGPLFGFGLYLLGYNLLKVSAIANSVFAPYIGIFALVNLFWTVVNLFPVLPLDGGQLMRIVLEFFLGAKGFRAAVGLSLGFSVIFAFVAFFFNWFLIGAIFFLFGFQNIQTWKLAKTISSSDHNQTLQKELFQAEEFLISGEENKAKAILENLREKSKSGMLFDAATQHLVRIHFKNNEVQKVYDLLLSIEDHLNPEFLELLHFASFELKDYERVKALSADCFRNDPCLEVAIRNAIAFATLKDVDSTVGWLQASLRTGLENPKDILNEKAFDNIREEPKFQEFQKQFESND